jgi:hypothetical protein
MSKEKGSAKSEQSGHPRAKLAAEIGAAGVGALLVAGAGYAAWRRYRAETLNVDLSDDVEVAHYKKSMEIFDDARLKPAERDAMAKVAVRVHYATVESAELMVTRDELREQLADEKFYLVKRAIARLKDHKLIESRQSTVDAKRSGYYAQPALTWALAEGDYSVLQEAQAEYLYTQL